jgi:hypothetical protein
MITITFTESEIKNLMKCLNNSNHKTLHDKIWTIYFSTKKIISNEDKNGLS